MFGRIRASPSPSPAEWLESERPSSKIFKDDSLSIYEATLVKLKQGSQRILCSEHCVSPLSQDSMDFESVVSENSSMVSGSCSEQRTPTCSTESSSASINSAPNHEQEKGKDVSIRYLFSKYNSSHIKQGLHFYNNEMIVENSSSTNVSVSCSDSQSTGGSK